MQLSRTRLAAGLAAAVLPLAVLASCGEDEPQPKFEEPTSASPSESSSPEEPAEPTPPAAMKGDDVKAAEAFVKYYFATMNYAGASGDSARLKTLSLGDCGGCNGVLALIEETYANGGVIKGGAFAVESIELAALGKVSDDAQPFRGITSVSYSKQTIRGSGNERTDGRFPAGRSDLEVVAIRSAQGWRMAEWHGVE